MRYQRGFINCNKFTILAGDIDDKERHPYMGSDSIRDISLSSSQFCSEPKSFQKKNSGYLKDHDDDDDDDNDDDDDDGDTGYILY